MPGKSPPGGRTEFQARTKPRQAIQLLTSIFDRMKKKNENEYKP
jgi:hypothetical protein